MLSLLFDFCILLIVIVALPLAGYGIFLSLVRANIFWTEVESGWCKIILEWKKYERIIEPGLHWVGIPGINSLYSRKMTFFKSVTDNDGRARAKPHDDEDISSFKTTRYPYAIPFKDEEDSKGLPLFGVLAADGVIEDYEKAFFKVSDWYAETNTRILSCFSRKVLILFSYDDDIVGRDTVEEQAKKNISVRLWEELNSRPNGNPSILEELHDVAGIRIYSVELRSVDPPEGWRATTLAPYKAQREKDAARHQAEASAILFDDTNQALKIWLESQRATGHKPTQTQVEAKQDELRQRALAKTPGYQQIHIKGLEGATTAVVGGGGGGVGVFVGAGGGNNPGKNPGGSQKKKVKDMTEEEKEDAFKDV